MPPFRRAALVAAVLVAAPAAGCEAARPPAPLTRQQVVDRVVSRAREAFQQLPFGASLDVDRDEPAKPCAGGRTFVETGYAIEYPAGWPVERTVTTLADFWTKLGYRTVRDERNRVRVPAFAAEDPDGFRVAARLAYRDTGRFDAYLVSSSPCV